MNKQEFEDVKIKFAKETRAKRISKWLNVGSLSFAVLGSVMASTFFLDNIKVSDNDNLTTSENLKAQIEKLKTELNESKKLNIKLSKIQENQSVTKNENTQFIRLQKDVETLNQAILNSPEKAISIPILKIEMENQKEQNEKEIKSIKDDITRVYDMSKWIIGLVFTMLVSIIVLNISNLFAKNNKKE
jgi:ABC-type phosphate transport system auxiliary subunit